MKYFNLIKSVGRSIVLQLFVLLILCNWSSYAAYTSSPQNQKLEEIFLDLDLKGASPQEFFEQLKENTGVYFFFSNEDLNELGEIDLVVKQESLKEVLDVVFKDTNLTYKLDNNVVTIKKIAKPAQKQEQRKKELKGTVTDENGETIPGVSVVVKGTNIGSATDIDGKYSILLPVEGGTLIFSFVGMETQLVTVDSRDRSVFNVILQSKSSELIEVVVTGFQTINKRESTASISSLKIDEIEELGVTRLDQMLQGKVPGMTIMQSSSSIGATPKIRIRGSSTIMGSREPVWVLDGMVLDDPVNVDAAVLNSMDKVNLIGNAISFLNPSDIERIDVLKDASATALYGMQAANGVIVITTKKGKIGKPNVNYSYNVTFNEAPSYKDMYLMNSKERIELSEEMHEKNITSPAVFPSYNVGYEGELLKLYHNKISYDEFARNVKDLKETNTDWYDLLFRNSINQSHNVSVGGGTDRVTYYTGVGYNDLKGISRAESQNRINISSKIGIKLSEKLSANFSLMFANTRTSSAHSDVNLYQYAYDTSRAISPYNEDGSYKFYDVAGAFGYTPALPMQNLQYNILNELDETGQDRESKTFNFKFDFNYKINSNLKWKSFIAYSNNNNKSEEVASERSHYISTKRKTRLGDPLLSSAISDHARYSIIPFGGLLNTATSNVKTITSRTSIDYNKRINDHSFSFMAGGEMRSTHYTGVDANVYGYFPERGKTFISIKSTEWTGAAAEIIKRQPRITDNKNNVLSFFSAFAYSYKQKYILSLNARGDASNKLGFDKKNRFLPIWALSGRWNIINESFMDNIDFISDLSIKGSYGLQGNVTDAHIPTMVAKVLAKDVNSNQFASSLVSLPNRGLRWEKTRSSNYGVDLSVLNNRLSIGLEFYNKTGKDQIIHKVIEGTNGGTNVVMNGGTIENKGWELNLVADIIRNENTSWNFSFNTSKNTSKLSNLYKEQALEFFGDYINGKLLRNGSALNEFYSYRFDKLDENGAPTFKGLDMYDSEGNQVIHGVQEAIDMGLVSSGNLEPDFSGGFASSFRYKKFTLSAAFYFQLGASARLNTLYTNGNYYPFPEKNYQAEFVNRWQKPGDENITNIPAVTNDPLYYDDGYKQPNSTANVLGSFKRYMYDNSDLRVIKNDFLRCRSISLNYTVPEGLLSNLKIKHCSITGSVTNPFVLKNKALKGRDPEQVDLSSGAIPPQTSYSLSLNLNF